MNICFATLSYPRNGSANSGVGSQVQTIAHSLIDAGHNVSVLNLTTKEETRETDDRGVEIYNVRSGNLHWFASKLPFVGKALALPLREIEYAVAVWRGVRRANSVRKLDLIEGCETGMLLVTLLRGKTPVIIRLHGEKYTFDKYTPGRSLTAGVRLSRMLQRVALRRASVLVSPSRGHAREIARELRHHETSIRIIPNATNLIEPRAPRTGNDNPTVLFAGRLEPVKGILVLLEAAAEVVKQLPMTRFVLAGNSHPALPLENLESSIRDYRLEKNVMQVGALKKGELESWYRRASLCVVPSHYESFGLVALEAMAAGLPVVATRVAGLPELVESGMTGLLVEAADAKSLAAAITRVLNDPVSAAAMGTAARERVREKFLVSQNAPLNLSLYQEFLRSKNVGADLCVRPNQGGPVATRADT
ncbi:MAG TPA: glycosyltransferase family 4 protein [Pyrinomonadaceae bacterium]